MALHTIQIVVVDGGKEGSYRANNATRKSTNTGEETDKTLYEMLNIKGKISQKIKSAMSPQTYFVVNQAVDMGTQIIKSMHNYRVSDIGRKHGDSNYQAIVNRRYELGGQVLSMIGYTFNGAMAGAMTGNPIGVAVGMVAGLASSVISLGFQESERQRGYRHTMFKESNANNYAIERNSGDGFLRLR